MPENEKPYLFDGARISRDEYNSIRFDAFLTRVPKGDKRVIQSHATAQGESLNGFVNRAITETIGRDNKNKG